MLPIFSILAPIFALILSGWIARKSGTLGPTATSEMNRFVVYLALPALLFDVVANAKLNELWQPEFLGTFGLSVGLVFFLTILIAIYLKKNLADASIDGLNSSYANTGFIGFPLTLAVFGSSALIFTMIASIITVCILFASALVLVEFGTQTEKRRLRVLKKVFISLSKNPILIASLLGVLFLISGKKVPIELESFIKLLGGAAPPCALVTIGLFLAEKREPYTLSNNFILLLVGIKLILQPLLTWFLAGYVFNLSREITDIAVLLSALPTGTGPFMIAELYGRESATTSKVILMSTILSLITLTAYLNWR